MVASALIVGGCGGGGGGSNDATPPPTTAYTDSVQYSAAGVSSLPTAAEITAVTHHQLTLNGTVLNYTATTGHMTATALTTGAAEASFFYVAYTLDGRDPATRPVTFFYNGGPGSSTVWLHLGSFGPKRLVTGDPATTAPTPFPLVDNSESLLDVSDLVFVDAIGSGLSEAIAPNRNQTFWGVDVDAAVFRDFVMRYIAVNSRSASPKFLFGESYGTTRSGVLANLLETAGVHLNGVVLQSSVLNYNTNCALFTIITASCAAYLPSYAAIGAWFNLDNPNPTAAGLPAFVTQSRTFATSQYGPAVDAFLAAGTHADATLLTQLVNITGVTLANWQAHFNLDPETLQHNLIPGTVLGRYDARVNAPAGSFLASEDDPSSTFIDASFAAGITGYLGSSLLYTNPSTYITLGNAANTWAFHHDGMVLPDVIPDIAAAMTQNPKMKILSLNGYHDLATPFFQTERDLARLGSNPNITTRFYSGGHMTYLDDAARSLEKADLVQFYQSATASQ